MKVLPFSNTFFLFGFQNFGHSASSKKVGDFGIYGTKTTPSVSQFHLNESLKPHQTADGLYSCPHCSFKAPRVYNLRRHMRTHFPSQKCICYICGNGYVENHLLKRHMLTVHGFMFESPSLNVEPQPLTVDSQPLDVKSQASKESIVDNSSDVSRQTNVEPQTESEITKRQSDG